MEALKQNLAGKEQAKWGHLPDWCGFAIEHIDNKNLELHAK